MASMNVSVPDLMRDWVQSRIESGKYASASDYIRDLIRKDQAAALDQDQRLSALDESIARGLAEVEAGLGRDLDDVCDELTDKYERMAEKSRPA